MTFEALGRRRGLHLYSIIMATCKKTLYEKLIRDGLKAHKILLFLLKNNNEPVGCLFRGKECFTWPIIFTTPAVVYRFYQLAGCKRTFHGT